MQGCSFTKPNIWHMAVSIIPIWNTVLYYLQTNTNCVLNVPIFIGKECCCKFGLSISFAVVCLAWPISVVGVDA